MTKNIYIEKISSSKDISFISICHDDVIEWKHFPSNWPFVRGIHRSPAISPHKGQWRGALMFSLICAWINEWENNRETGDLRHHRAHYDVIIILHKMLQYMHISCFTHFTYITPTFNPLWFGAIWQQYRLNLRTLHGITSQAKMAAIYCYLIMRVCLLLHLHPISLFWTAAVCNRQGTHTPEQVSCALCSNNNFTHAKFGMV